MTMQANELIQSWGRRRLVASGWTAWLVLASSVVLLPTLLPADALCRDKCAPKWDLSTALFIGLLTAMFAGCVLAVLTALFEVHRLWLSGSR